ncbi:MAG TPA: Fur family transcriptional regulator [Pseudomonas sp.]|nr:Fur family transcriptional regulator [Pseudomonas sp.]
MYRPHTQTPLACRPHDHAQCVDNALAEADALCARQGVRLTALRRRVLELVWQSHKPLGAYDILGTLSEEDGRRAAPPTVYRALDFLLENGLIHRIASLNAFIGCIHPERNHQGQFLICRECRTTIELSQPSISEAIVASAQPVGFQVEQQTVEVVGLCSRCREAA